MTNTGSNKTGKQVSPLLLLLLVSGVLFTIIAFATALRQPESAANSEVLVQDASAYAGTIYDPPVELQDFVMAGSTGEDIRLSDFRGRFVLLFFGFTHCPDVCPTTLATFRQVREQIGDAAAKTAVLFISVDAPRDTPDVIAKYLRNFDPGFVGMSGDDETLQAIALQFGLVYERQNLKGQSSYSVDHTGRSYLIDPEGRLRVSYAYGTEAEIIADGLNELMR